MVEEFCEVVMTNNDNKQKQSRDGRR